MPDPNDIPYFKQLKDAKVPDDYRKIPIVKEIYGTANAITDFIEYGCYPHYSIWIDTLFPALGKVIWQLLFFGLDDVARGYFRPTNTRGIGRRTRVPIRGQKNRANRAARNVLRKGIPEIGEEIGKRLPGSKAIQGRKVSGLQRWFWVIDGVAQRALWYWLIADISEGFVVNWTTAIMESEACKKPDYGTVRARRTSGLTTGADNWSAIVGWSTETDTTNGKWTGATGQLTVPAGLAARVTLWGTSGNLPPGTHQGNQLGVFAPTETSPESFTSPWPLSAPDDPRDTSTVGTIRGPVVLQLAVKNHGTGFQELRTADVMIALYDPSDI